jgi:hypothetical protein
MRFGESVTLESGDPDVGTAVDSAVTGRLDLPHAGAWARLLTGRLDPDHTPPGGDIRGQADPAGSARRVPR